MEFLIDILDDRLEAIEGGDDRALVASIKGLRARGHSLRRIAEELDVGRGTVEKYVKEEPNTTAGGRAVRQRHSRSDILKPDR